MGFKTNGFNCLKPAFLFILSYCYSFFFFKGCGEEPLHLRENYIGSVLYTAVPKYILTHKTHLKGFNIITAFEKFCSKLKHNFLWFNMG